MIEPLGWPGLGQGYRSTESAASTYSTESISLYRDEQELTTSSQETEIHCWPVTIVDRSVKRVNRVLGASMLLSSSLGLAAGAFLGWLFNSGDWAIGVCLGTFVAGTILGGLILFVRTHAEATLCIGDKVSVLSQTRVVHCWKFRQIEQIREIPTGLEPSAEFEFTAAGEVVCLKVRHPEAKTCLDLLYNRCNNAVIDAMGESKVPLFSSSPSKTWKRKIKMEKKKGLMLTAFGCFGTFLLSAQCYSSFLAGKFVWPQAQPLGIVLAFAFMILGPPSLLAGSWSFVRALNRQARFRRLDDREDDKGINKLLQELYGETEEDLTEESTQLDGKEPGTDD